MAFRIDMSPLTRASENRANLLTGIGQNIASGIQQRRQDQQQQDLNVMINQALSGDEQAMNFVASRDPNLAMQIKDHMMKQVQTQQQAETQEQERFQGERATATADFVERMHLAAPEVQDAMFEDAINNPMLDIDEEDRPFFKDANARKALVSQVKGKDYAENFFGVEGGDTPASVRETQWYLKQTPEVREKHLELKRKTDPTMAQKLEQAQKESDIKVAEAGRKEQSKGIAQRKQGYIDSGIEAADSLGNINQSLELLNSVETGGFDNVALRAKQLFGIESADEAQLSAGLGKAILSQLKPIFGAAFTAAEGERLERIEANFGKSTAGNKRLLEEVKKITERAARRGLKAAEESGDEFTAQEIQSAMDALKGVSKDSTEQSGSSQSATNDTSKLSDADLLNMYGGQDG